MKIIKFLLHIFAIYLFLMPFVIFAADPSFCSSAKGICKVNCEAGETMNFDVKNCPTGQTCCDPASCSFFNGNCRIKCETGEVTDFTVTTCAQGESCCTKNSIYEQIPEGAANVDFQKMLKEEIGEKPEQAEGVGALKQGAAKLNPMNIGAPSDLLARGVNALLAFMGSIALVLYIYAGFIWMSASGSAEKVSKAKAILIWTTLGIAAMGASYMVINTILARIG